MLGDLESVSDEVVRIIVICPIKSHNPALSLWNKQPDMVNNLKSKMQQDRLTASKIHGLRLIKKVHETKTFRKLGEKQALQVQNKDKKTQPLCKSWTALWQLFREKAQMSMDQQTGTPSNLQKDKKPAASVHTRNILKKTFSVRNQGSIIGARMKNKEKVVDTKYLFTLHVGNSKVLMSTFWKNRRTYIKYPLLQCTLWETVSRDCCCLAQGWNTYIS